jgi:ABC-type lipoprotein release transport system permease subunit
MKLALLIAKRYLFAKKSQNIINIISMISVMGVFTGTMALLIVMSVFNGLHGFVGSLFGTFDPDLKITPTTGKVFTLSNDELDKIRSVEGIMDITTMLSDNGLLKYSSRQMPAIILGVDSHFNNVTGIDSIMEEGSSQLANEKENRALLGYILADQLGTRTVFVSPLTMYAPKRTGEINMAMPERSFNTEYASPTGIFAVKQVEYDGNYVIIDIGQAQRLFDYDSKTYSSVGIKLKEGIDSESIKAKIRQQIGQDFKIENKYEQHASFFKMMKVEKLMAFLILSFILVIAAFNIIGSLSMLIFEKKESIFILKSMGADQKLVTRIFLFEGWLISLTGIVTGIIAGSALVLIQQHFGIIKFQGMGAYILDAYPVQLILSDIVLVLLTVSTIGVLAAWYPVKSIVGRYYNDTKE